MTVLWFLIALAAIIFAVLALEGDGARAFPRPTGLLTWLTHGNWPAKVGGALVVVGVGALLRYALLSIDVAPPVKLAGGVALALGLGFASSLLPAASNRRAVSLALGGAAFGVAYLTGYSAFALFGYLSNPVGIGLLAVTAAAAGAYAVTRSALSLAVLSMVGAYLAPAFALTDPGPQVVYGYYVAASLLTLIMVAIRGWHPLIHLSFVFTLAGGVFFAWTSSYYVDQQAGVMLPMILLLAAVHVTMPIVERAADRAPWIERLDLAYTIALPAVTAVLCAILAPGRTGLSNALLSLAGIWVVAVIALRLLRREGVAVHGIIAALLVVLAVAARFKDLPWELLSLALSVASLAVVARVRTPVGRLHDVLAGLVVLFGTVHILVAAVAADTGDVFLSGGFIERLIGAALLTYAGIACRRIDQQLDTLLIAMGIVWGAVALGIQVVRWDLATGALVVHGALLLVAGSLWIPGRKVLVADRNAGLLSMAVLLTAFWAASDLSMLTVAWGSGLAAALALIGVAVRPVVVDSDRADDRLVAALVAPWVAIVWAAAGGRLAGVDEWQLALLAGVAVIVVLLVTARGVAGERSAWLDTALDVYGVAVGALLAVATLADIAPGIAAIALEVTCLAALGLIARMRYTRGLPHALAVVVCVVGAALVLQANLMRALGPGGHLDISDLMRLRLPAVISLVWVVAGCALTITSRRVGSRTAWVAGAALLVAAAAKLFVLDFGSLGQLANILAVIAAGVVFLLVGWLAPMPPAASRPARGSDGAARAAPASGLRRLGWGTTAVLAVIALVNYSRLTSEEHVREPVRGPADDAVVELAEPGPAAAADALAADPAMSTQGDPDPESGTSEAPTAEDAGAESDPAGDAEPAAEDASGDVPLQYIEGEDPLAPRSIPGRVQTPPRAIRSDAAGFVAGDSGGGLFVSGSVDGSIDAQGPANDLPGLPPAAVGAPVHVVGVYEGTPVQGRPGGRRQVAVTVRTAGRPIVLVLTAHESVEWVIERGARRVAAVLLSGYAPSTVSGLGDVPVLRIGQASAFIGNGAGYEYLRETVARYTGSTDIRSFQGTYAGSAFSVGP